MEKKKIIINVVIYIILFIILDIFFGIVYSGDTRQRENYLYIIPSILVYSLIYIFILIISKNTKKTNITISIILFVFAVINHIKILASGNPIFITDIEMLSNAGEIATLAISVLTQFSTYVPLIILGAILILINYVGAKEKIVLNDISKVTSAIICTACVLMMVVVFLPIQSKDEFLLKKIYRTEDRKDYKAFLSNVVYYKQYGVIGGLIENLLETRRYTPENYNEEILLEALENANKALKMVEDISIMVDM